MDVPLNKVLLKYTRVFGEVWNVYLNSRLKTGYVTFVVLESFKKEKHSHFDFSVGLLWLSTQSHLSTF